MKRVWVCQWEVAPGDGMHAEEFSSFPEAVKAMRQKITQHIDLTEYLKELDPVAANYIGNYLSDPEFPRSEADEPRAEDWELPEEGDLALYSSWIRWEFPGEACPVLNTTIVMNPDPDEKCFLDFWFECPEKAKGNGAKGMSIRIIPCMNFGTSAYPLMIWRVLREKPQNQTQIANRVMDMFGTAVERKAISRHLRLLQNLGLPVRQDAQGYYIGGEYGEPKPEKYGTSAYPVMVWHVLEETPKTQEAIIQAVLQRYNTKIERKAVSRHLELLEALQFPVRRSPEGCYIEK